MDLKSLLNDEGGSIIILTLIFLVLLTVMGLSGTSTSSIEVQIAGNNARYKQNLYLAEAVAMEAAQMVEDGEAADLALTSSTWVDWLYSADAVNLEDPAVMWANGKVSTVSPNTKYAATISGIAAGSSLDMSQPSQLYEIGIYGVYQGRGFSHIAIGYRKRF